MHILTMPKDGPTLRAGEWVMEDGNAATYMLTNQEMRPTMRPLPYFPRNADDKRCLIVGTLGYGDAIMFTPILRQAKKVNPDWELHIACMAEQRQVFLGLPYVDGFVDYPVPLAELSKYGNVIFLEGSVEFNPLAKTEHMTDRFAETCGWRGDSWVCDKKPDLILSGDERVWALKSFPPNEGKRRLGLQVQAGARNRTYPISKFMEAQGDKMLKAGWEICLLGVPGEFRAERLAKGIYDMSRMGLTWRQTVAFMTTCDCILAPDSSLMHAAGALDIPCVALFGPFDYKLRTAYYTSVFSLHGEGVCPMAPCFHSHHSGLPVFPAGGPCNQSGVCEELASITPERVRGKIEQVARNPLEGLPPALPA